MTLAYSEQPTVEILYELFSKDVYNPRRSWVLPAEFVLDPLYQAPARSYTADQIGRAHV